MPVFPGNSSSTMGLEAEFLDVIRTIVLRVFSLLFTVTLTSTNGYYPPPPPRAKVVFETGL
jgi:hypothetical protein